MALIRLHRSLACLSFLHLRPRALQGSPTLHTSSCLQWFAHCLFLLWIHRGPVMKELARIKLLIFNRMNCFLPVVRTHGIEFKQDLQLPWVFWYDDIVLSVSRRRKKIYFTGLETFCCCAVVCKLIPGMSQYPWCINNPPWTEACIHPREEKNHDFHIRILENLQRTLEKM